MSAAAALLLFFLVVAANRGLVQCCLRSGPSHEDVDTLRQDIATLRRNLKHLEIQHENLVDETRRTKSQSQYSELDTGVPSADFTEQLEALKITVDELLLKQNQLMQLVETIEPKKQKVMIDRLEKQLDDKINEMTKNLEQMEQKSNKQQGEYRDTFKKMDESVKVKMKELLTTLKDVEDTSQRNFSLVQESLENLNAVVNKDIKQKVEEFSEHISTIRTAKDEIDAILSQVQHDVHRIVPNTFNKEALIMAIMIVVVIVFILGLCLYRVNQKVEEMKKFP
ncbi:nucleoprotein TPR-like [Mercenaria mercenaria]|uniref:nucleoprotein TPR-like n=1 Tax=Mercenaria mercenaria TaxID=6596 RepID=UPI00234F88AA|nr:nucleoprotein TPR-like [Mercenaria mercenaria]